MFDGKIPCRNHKFCPYVMERRKGVYRISLIWNYQPGGENLPCENVRTMDPEKALPFVYSHAQAAVNNNCDVFIIDICGGNPFSEKNHSFEDFRYLYNQVLSTLSGVTTVFRLFVQTAYFTPNARKWYASEQKNNTEVYLYAERVDDMLVELLEEMNGQLGVIYRITPENVRVSAKEDIAFLLGEKAAVQLSIVPYRGRNEVQFQEDCDKLLQQLSQMESANFLLAGDELIDRLHAVAQEWPGRGQASTDFPGNCLDTTGYIWDCPRCSPLRFHSFEMNPDTLNTLFTEQEDVSALEWICPGEAMVSGFQLGQLQKMQAWQFRTAEDRIYTENDSECVGIFTDQWEKMSGNLKNRWGAVKQMEHQGK